MPGVKFNPGQELPSGEKTSGTVVISHGRSVLASMTMAEAQELWHLLTDVLNESGVTRVGVDSGLAQIQEEDAQFKDRVWGEGS